MAHAAATPAGIVGDLGHSHEVERGLLHDRLGHVFQEIKYPGLLLLVLSECLIIHKQIYCLAIAIDGIDPLREFRRIKRIFSPSAIAEPESDIIGKLVIFQKQFYFFGIIRTIKEVRRFAF